MIIISLAILSTITEKDCLNAFSKYKRQFRKEYGSNLDESLAFGYFCNNYKIVRNYKGQYALRLNDFSDQPNPPKQHYIEPDFDFQGFDAQESINKLDAMPADMAAYNRDPTEIANVKAVCPAKINSPTFASEAVITSLKLATIPPRVDLRKLGTVLKPMDQGSCGSCYTFAAVLQFGSILMHDLPYYAQDPILGATWNFSSETLKLSTQYVLNKTFGTNQYCSGGNYHSVAADLANFRIDTMELASNFPYTAMFDSDNLTYTAKPVSPTAKLNASQVINPVHHFGYEPTKSNCPIANFNLNFQKADHVAVLKSVLARGIAVAGAMHTEGGSAAENSAFTLYADGLFNTTDKCLKDSTNHQITIVGYGTYKNNSVWVFQNSWGSSWGVSGTFMVPIGRNVMCTEKTAAFLMPRYYGFNSTEDAMPFESTDLYKKNNKTFVDYNANKIIDGKNGLDFANSTWIEMTGNTGLLVAAIIGGIGGILFAYFFLVWMLCPPANVLKPTIYVKFSETQGDKEDWKDAKLFPKFSREDV